MTVIELYRLVESYYGYKIHMRCYNSEKNEVTGILYDAFVLKCELDERYGCFGAGIVVGNRVNICEFLGKECSLNSDEKSIKESLDKIDEYCRLRLPDKYLDAYYKAYAVEEQILCGIEDDIQWC